VLPRLAGQRPTRSLVWDAGSGLWRAWDVRLGYPGTPVSPRSACLRWLADVAICLVVLDDPDAAVNVIRQWAPTGAAAAVRPGRGDGGGVGPAQRDAGQGPRGART